MRRTNTITVFHEKAPKKLVALYKKKGGNCYAVAKEINVNPSHVWQLLKNGKEPKREETRQRLFLRHKKTPEEIERERERRKQERELLPGYILQWTKLSRKERYKVIEQYITWRNKNGTNTKKDLT